MLRVKLIHVSKRDHWWEQGIDSFTLPLHSPNDMHLPAVRAVQRDYHWDLKKKTLGIPTGHMSS